MRERVCASMFANVALNLALWLRLPGSCSRYLRVQNMAYTNRAYVSSADPLAQMKAPFVQFGEWCVCPSMLCTVCLNPSRSCVSCTYYILQSRSRITLTRTSMSQYRLVGLFSKHGAWVFGTMQSSSPGNLTQPPSPCTQCFVLLSHGFTESN